MLPPDGEEREEAEGETVPSSPDAHGAKYSQASNVVISNRLVLELYSLLNTPGSQT